MYRHVAHITELQSFQFHQSFHQLLKNRIGCYTAEVIIDIATISGKFTWNFVDMVLRNPGKANCCHPALMVLNSDWSSLGCFCRLSLEIELFSLKFRLSHLLKHSLYFLGRQIWDSLYIAFFSISFYALFHLTSNSVLTSFLFFNVLLPFFVSSTFSFMIPTLQTFFHLIHNYKIIFCRKNIDNIYFYFLIISYFVF
jgi:hypothetical protein